MEKSSAPPTLFPVEKLKQVLERCTQAGDEFQPTDDVF